MKVAAVAVGGVVVGALTMGIGLIPYVTVVGLTAVAGGGAVALQYIKPPDSRMIVACETMYEAISWKEAIEKQIQKLESVRKPILPPSANPQIISSIIGLSNAGEGWKNYKFIEGLKILEQIDSSDDIICRKTQLMLPCTAVKSFLTIMEVPSHYWPRNGQLKTIKVVDDHLDKIQLDVHYGKKYNRKILLNRFWKFEDDGTYLITLTKIETVDDFGKKVKLY